ncbi:MAG: GNAT family N-acetyltransferase [Burkholderiales bacterium]|nr:GNAT family N-acetyltransferase [Burkholderiales bacterium]
MTPMLRTPLAADYVCLAAWISDADACARWAGPQLPYPFAASELAQLLEKPDSASRVLMLDDETPAGFGQYWRRDAQRVHLGRIIVHPQQRGRGVARQLCRLLMQEGRAAFAADILSLRVYRDNLAALKTYVGLGFVPVESESSAEVLAMECRRTDDF